MNDANTPPPIDYRELQELPGQKLHLVPETDGRPRDVAICGRNNRKTGAWQRTFAFTASDVEPGCICRNCLRVKQARQARKQKEQANAHSNRSL